MEKRYEVWPVERLVPYENNPRINDPAVEDVMESIRQTGNLDPIEVDEDGVILSGHTRLKALLKLGYRETGIMVYEGLTEAQKRKYRLLAKRPAKSRAGTSKSWIRSSKASTLTAMISALISKIRPFPETMPIP